MTDLTVLEEDNLAPDDVDDERVLFMDFEPDDEEPPDDLTSIRLLVGCIEAWVENLGHIASPMLLEHTSEVLANL